MGNEMYRMAMREELDGLREKYGIVLGQRNELREALRPCTGHLDGLVNLNPAGTVVNIDKARVAVATAYAVLKDTAP